VKICGMACVMDVPAMLTTSMRHLVLNGIRDFYLFDHGNDPCLLSSLSEAFNPEEIRLQVLRKETPSFFQGAMINTLAELARVDGFDIAVAFDSDEFWCSTVKGRTLADQIRIEMSSGVEALRIPFINYLQHYTVDTFSMQSLLQCQYAAVPIGDSRHPRDQMNAGIPFAALPFPSKMLPRLSREIRLTEGYHNVTGHKGEDRLLDAVGIVVRHLPFHSRSHVNKKKEQGLRRIADGFPFEMGGQSQRLAYLSNNELDIEWLNNAWRCTADQKVMAGTYDCLVQDEGLVQIGRELAAIDDGRSQVKGTVADDYLGFQGISSWQLEHLVQYLVDDCGKAERVIAKLTLMHEQALLKLLELDAMRASPWWRLTAPLRAIAQRLKETEKRLRRFRKRVIGN